MKTLEENVQHPTFNVQRSSICSPLSTRARATVVERWKLNVERWTFSPFRRLAACFLAGSVSTLSAQEKPAAPKVDPFVKDSAPLQVEPGQERNLRLMTVLEVYDLPQSEAAAILASEADHQKRYELVRARLKDGKARLADVIAVATKSGAARRGGIDR